MIVIEKNGITFPWFTVENGEFQGALSLIEMKKTLEKGGFNVLRVFNLEGQILKSGFSSIPPNFVRFEVDLPKGWELTEGYNGYGDKEPFLMHLLDENRRLRAVITMDWETEDPQEAELFCRYSLNPYSRFYNNRLVETPEDHIVDVVVDRAQVSHEKPHDFPRVVHYDIRPVNKTPYSHEEFRAHLQRDLERILAGEPELDPPIYRWLHETYAHWRDPFAY